MKLVVSRRVTQRIREIASYIHEHDPSAALKVQRALLDAFALLASHPFLGRPFRGDVRRFAMPRLPSVIFYVPDSLKNELTIVTVRHTAQKPL